MADIVQLAHDIILMRKYPLRDNGARRYPVAAQQFSQAVAACDDLSALRDIIAADTGHLLPTPTKQQVYEKLLAHPEERTASMLRAYAMHLEMFGYSLPDGTLQADTDAMVDKLLAEADAL
jgi:hypothetical protein